MNAMLNIQVRVAAQQANAALAQTAGGLKGVGAAAGAASAGGFGKFASGMHTVMKLGERWGKNLQWIGRQLEFNFTLPIAAAGYFATKWALDNERAMTQVRKVYGDLSFTQERIDAETKALATTFELLSNRFGENQAEVINVGAAWAAAGSAGVGLARNVKNTMELAILGEMELTEATEALIATMSAYGLTSQEMRQELALMNTIENETAVRMRDLIDVVQRSGGAARTAGVDIRHLSAMTAQIVPAAGGAAQAGNALRTIISRLMSPTGRAADELNRMGLEVDTLGWTSLNFIERMERMSESWKDLTSSERAYITSTIASRWQVNRFDILMQGFIDTNSRYKKALEVTGDQVRANAVYQKELLTVLESNPKQFEIMANVIKNSLTKAIIPLLPTILSVIKYIASLAKSFADLDPNVRKTVAAALLFLAVTGPIIRYLGATILLFSQFGLAVGSLAQALGWVTKNVLPLFARGFRHIIGFLLRFTVVLAMSMGTMVKIMATGMLAMVKVMGAGMVAMSKLAWGGLVVVAKAMAAGVGAIAAAIGAPVWVVVAVIAAVVAAIVLIMNDDLRGGVIDAIQGIVDGLAQLPSIIASVFSAVVRVIAAAMRAVIEWLSYLNPFARHSPSLVDNVKAGVRTILDEYNSLRGVPAVIRSAARAHQEFLNATGKKAGSFQQDEYNAQRQEIVAAVPSSGPAVSNMIASIWSLKKSLKPLQAEIDAQTRVVSQWEAKLAPVTKKLRLQEEVLSDLEYQLGLVETAMRDAQQTMDDLASTPIEGMGAFEDQIFANEMAQKALRLEIMKLEEAGQSVEDLQQKYADLNGMIELLRGERESLRMAGAGSDILGVYDQELAALEAQRDAMEGQKSEVQELQDALAELQRQGEMLELEKALQFDEQLRQIEQMVDGLEEMPFDEIVASIKDQQDTIKRLQPEYDRLSGLVEDQRAAVEATRREHDKISARLEIEQDKLDRLTRAYSDIEQQIREMESAMQGFASAAKSAREEAERAAKAAGGDRPEFGDYDIPGGEGVLNPEGGLFDIEQFNKDLEAELESILGDMDLLSPFKDAWKKVTDWFKDAWKGISEPIKSGWNDLSGWFKRNLSLEGIGNAFGEVMDTIGGAFESVGRWISDVYDSTLGPVFSGISDWVGKTLGPVFEGFMKIVSIVWGAVSDHVSNAWEVIRPVLQAMSDFFNNYIVPVLRLFQTVAAIVFAVVTGVIKAAWGDIGPVLLNLHNWIQEKLGKAFSGFMALVGFVWNGVKGAILTAWERIRPVLVALRDFIANKLGTAFKLFQFVAVVVWNAIKSVIKGAWDNAIRPALTSMRNFINDKLAPVFKFLEYVVAVTTSGIRTTVSRGWDIIKGIITGAVNIFIGAFNKLADAINWVAGVVGVSSRVPHMPRLGGGGGGGGRPTKPGHQLYAEGGVMTPWGKAGFTEVNNGFVTNQVRAIVGEGSHHPEYVIPTDPRHRKRAMELFESLGGALMAGGGTVPVLGEGGFINDLYTAARNPFGTGSDIIKGLAGDTVGLAKKVWGAYNSARDIFSTIWQPHVAGTASKIMNWAFDWIKAGLKSMADAVRNTAGGFLDAINPVDDILRGVGLATGGQVPASPIDLAAGGVIRRRAGGTLLRVGEGRSDEKVQVLPVNRDDGSGDKVFMFYGDLSFPNITDPDDAKKFIDNLERLAG